MPANRIIKQKKQSGIALISAMLIVALATVITVSLTFDQSLIVQKSGHLMVRAQSQQLIFGLEDWAQTFLNKDAKDSKTDHLGENWAVQIPPLPVENGYLSGFIEDEQSKFNLNSLLSSPQMLVRFRVLCDQLDVDQEFISALLDWLDADIEVRYPDGAEDDYYSALTLPYRTGNQFMSDVSELLLVKGMTQEFYQKLLPFITVLPEATSLNVNTLSKEVYLSLDSNFEDTDYEHYFEQREDSAFTSIKDMTTKLKINIEEANLAVKTNYFLINGLIAQGDVNTEFHSLVQRKNSTSAVLHRRLGL